MHTNLLKLCTILLLFALVGASCQDNENLFELQIGDENALIQKEVNGIEFKFCLLNEKSQPATVFNEDENFIFDFSFENVKNDTVIVTTESLKSILK